jgi:hypothetical protein
MMSAMDGRQLWFGMPLHPVRVLTRKTVDYDRDAGQTRRRYRREEVSRSSASSRTDYLRTSDGLITATYA